MADDQHLQDHFFERDGDTLVPTLMTRGPWDARFQHGGPPAGLLAGAMQRFEGGELYWLARIWIELLRPVPVAPLRLEIAVVQAGRTVQRLEGALIADARTVAVARGLRIKRLPVALPAEPAAGALDPWPDPQTLADYTFTFFRQQVGYHRAVQLRLAHGAWGTTPVGFWARSRIPLVAGEPITPLENLMILADAQSGMGVPLDPERYTFLNPDLAVYFERAPVGSWAGFDIRSTANAEGAGLSQSAVRDARGLVARSAQSLVIVRR
jgi:hypothetical protein